MSFKTRAITGLSFAAVMVGVTLAHPIACLALFALVTFLCLWELSGLILVQDSPGAFNPIRRALFALLGMLPYTGVVLASAGFGSPFLVAMIPLLFSLFLFELFAQSAKPFDNIAYIALGIFYIGIPFALLAAMCIALTAADRSGNQFVLSILLMIWASDTGAYMLGSRIGRTKMFERISPKKTWEGTFSGAILAGGVGVLCQWVFPSVGFLWWQWAIFGAICAVLGVLGDLVESLLKRSLNIKDSGNILPGHGGFLDRFDSFIFVLPFIFTAFLLFG